MRTKKLNHWMEKAMKLEREIEDYKTSYKELIDAFVCQILKLNEKIKEKDALLEFYVDNKIPKRSSSNKIG